MKKDHKQTLINNKLIADFCGYAKADHEWRVPLDTIAYWINGRWIPSFALLYHEQHQWIIPVLEKIEKMGHKTVIGAGDECGHYCNIMYGLTHEQRLYRDKDLEIEVLCADSKALGKGDTKLEAIYNAVIEFINWFNENNDK